MSERVSARKIVFSYIFFLYFLVYVIMYVCFFVGDFCDWNVYCIQAIIALKKMFQWIYVERHTSGSSIIAWPVAGWFGADIPFVAFAAISSRDALFCISACICRCVLPTWHLFQDDLVFGEVSVKFCFFFNLIRRN